MIEGIDPAGMNPDPIVEFADWLGLARSANLPEPEAMVLATVDPAGAPSARAVLLRGFDDRGFVFYTNRTSHKGRDLEVEPRAALCFLWAELRRQVRVEGTATQTSDEETDAYWSTRPRGARLAATVSNQSAVIPSRSVLEEAMARLDIVAPDAVPRPREWGGYRLEPSSIEFWLGQEHRLHDRVRYRRHGEAWVRERLAP